MAFQGYSLCLPNNWRQIWRVTGRESGSPELLESPRTSPEVPRTSPEVLGDFPGSSLTVELNSNPEVPRKFPRLPRKFPGLPRKFPGLPWRSAVSLGSLTPSSDSQKLSLKKDALGGAGLPERSKTRWCHLSWDLRLSTPQIGKRLPLYPKLSPN